MSPGISGPGIRVYPFTNKELGFGLLLERDGGEAQLFFGTAGMSPAKVVQALVAVWRHKEGHSFEPPFVFFVDDADNEIGKIIDDLRMAWPRLYPGKELAVFVTNATKDELQDAVSEVLTDWNAQHPGVKYPSGIEEVTEH